MFRYLLPLTISDESRLDSLRSTPSASENSFNQISEMKYIFCNFGKLTTEKLFQPKRNYNGQSAFLPSIVPFSKPLKKISDLN